MEREGRYIVIKKTDLEAALKVKRITQTDIEDLKELLARLRTQRFISNKEALECVVVESDWPEYERVWQMIEDRVEGRVEEDIATLRKKADLFDKLRNLMGYVQNGTDEVIRIYQDDATMQYHVSGGAIIGKPWNVSEPSFEKVIMTAHKNHGGD